MRDILKPAVSLFVVTFIAAVCLGFVHEITKDPIALQKEKTEASAMQKILPAANTFKKAENIIESDGINNVTIGYDDNGTIQGYIFGVAPKGYGGAIEMLVSVDINGFVGGVDVIKHSETPGLGANAKNSSFTGQYIGKGGPFAVTKKPPADNEIEAIASATITTRAVTNGVNQALAYYNSVIKEGTR